MLPSTLKAAALLCILCCQSYAATNSSTTLAKLRARKQLNIHHHHPAATLTDSDLLMHFRALAVRGSKGKPTTAPTPIEQWADWLRRMRLMVMVE